MRGTLIFALVLSVLMVIFALLNNEDMVVNFGFFDTRGPKALVLIVTFVLGVIAGVLAMLSSRRRKRHDEKRHVEATSTATTAEPSERAETPGTQRSAGEARHSTGPSSGPSSSSSGRSS